MGALSNGLNLLGLVLLVHAVYSAHEHSLIPKRTPNPTSSSTSGTLSSLNPKVDLPLDITLETLVSVLLLCFGVVLGSPELKPITWRTWAGIIQKDKASQVKTTETAFAGSPYQPLEERVGFMDIRAKKKEFAEWVKSNGQQDMKR